MTAGDPTRTVPPLKVTAPAKPSAIAPIHTGVHTATHTTAVAGPDSTGVLKSKRMVSRKENFMTVLLVWCSFVLLVGIE